MNFLLFCGAGNSLSDQEVITRFPKADTAGSSQYHIQLPTVEEAISKVSQLGSAIKMAKLLPDIKCEAEAIAQLVTHKNFSLTVISTGKEHIDQREVKKLLPKSRFHEAKDYYGLSPIIVAKNNVDEFFLDFLSNQVWQTVWVHDFKHWIKKDRQLPYANAKAGMLPPKIARSLINLAPGEAWGKGKVLIDPFCGSGRVIVEALELGFDAYGVDISTDQAREAGLNLSHLGYDPKRISCLDSTHLSQIYANKADLIVTEPFMGKTNLRPDRVSYVVPGLKKLYLGSLKDWHKCLKPGGIVVMIFPILTDGKKDYKTSDIIDDKLSLSYNQLSKGVLYSRPDALVKREIHVLQKINL